jgi:hypothetical protein
MVRVFSFSFGEDTLIMNDQEHLSLIRKLVANARAIISYQVGLPLGCEKMYRLLYWLSRYETLDFPVFEKYTNAVRDLPTSTERLHCSREALRRYDEKLVAINLQYREHVLDACFAIIERYTVQN